MADNVMGLPARPKVPGRPSTPTGSRSGHCSNTPTRPGP